MDAATTLDQITTAIRRSLPAQISLAYFDGFLERHYTSLLQILESQLQTRALPEAWTPAQRTAANLAAMQIAASKHPEKMTEADRQVLARYSGWGGLSIEAVAEQFPTGFPAPDPSGLIHEYYTPTVVTEAVAEVVRPRLPDLAGSNGVVLALEPSAGIGRFVRSLSGPGFETLRWLVVERSQLSARILSAVRPDLAVYQSTFEGWVTEHGPAYAGRIGLVVSNPPYGPRGAAFTEDPDRSYREKQAYAYFLRRGLDLLAPGGLGVYLIPAGFLTGTGARSVSLRRKVLLRHHLSAAYRLPSGLFPGAQLVTDLLFFRARSAPLPEPVPADAEVLAGRYFEQFPTHILGTEIRKGARRGYQVQGAFAGLPELVERPLARVEMPKAQEPNRASKPRSPRRRSVVARRLEEDTSSLSPPLAAAVALGVRVDTYLATLARDEVQRACLLWRELHQGLLAWSEANGNPHAHRPLRALAHKGSAAAQRFLTAFDKAGALLEALSQIPEVPVSSRGHRRNAVALAEELYRTQRQLTVRELHQRLGSPRSSRDRLVQKLVTAGWAVDGEQLAPMEDYLTGHLWPKLDRALERGRQGDGVASAQARRLLEAIAPAVFEDIEGISPRQGWVPLSLVAGWMSEALNGRYGEVKLVRHEGLVQLDGVDYDQLGNASELAPQARWCLGWINHDRTVFRPKKRRDQNLDEVRLKLAAAWERSFHSWVSHEEDRRTRIETAYNRCFRGYVTPTYSAAPLAIGRWVRDGIRLHPHQAAAARRLLANRGGLLAFDVGVGKTYTGIAVLARARQEGWCRRPVVLVPNSIVWKWAADIARVLPNYRVVIIGSQRKVMRRGPRKGLSTSTTDTPEQRAQKWSAFQAGAYDVVLLTYTALARTQMNPKAVAAYAERTEAIQREVRLRQRNAKATSKPTERQRAVLKEGVAAWVAEMMELPTSWRYDPGIAWDDLGIDLLIVDEAQNFKNLYLPEPREGGVPRFMGNAGTGAKRAWQLDFRTATIRARTGGAGIVLLSATPAKNSPLELYNLLQLVDHDAFSRMGIRDPEQFIDRYLQIELKAVVDAKLSVVERSAVTGFQNLHELRDVIFRYGEFKTAEDVGLKLPEPTVQIVEVDMDRDQDRKYADYVGQIEHALESSDTHDKAQILGLLARLALVAIHPRLDEGFDWKSAASSGVDPHSPKLDAMARRVAANQTCGHIVFVDNVAVHRWAVAVLVQAGVPEDRIAVLNATTAKAAADRQRIAAAFNGDPDEGIPPAYDVVIANAIAYEGIDLQTRTCAIHHLDLPWEPATLQQRNGRGVRQGNTLGAIEIDYYFARRSQDGLRFNLIQGKLSWMTQLLKSQERATNNPGAQLDMGPEEILLLVSRDPEKTAARLAEVKARREAEARQKVARDAARLLRSVDARLRKAERTADPAEATSLRQEADERLEDLARVDPVAWPWGPWLHIVRRQPVLVPPDGQAPVWEGLRIAVPSSFNPEILEHAQFGRLQGTTIGVRRAGNAQWSPRTLEQIAALRLEPGHLDAPWPDEDTQLFGAVSQHLAQALRYSGDWSALGWTWAANAWLVDVWERHGPEIVDRLASVSGWYAEQQRIPLVVGETLQIAGGAELRQGKVLPPTLAGWQRFLALAPSSEITFTALAQAGTYWWARRIPRDLRTSEGS